MSNKYDVIKQINDNKLLIYYNGEILEIPKNKFYNGEYVKTSVKHYSQKDFIKLLEPTWTKERGWVYGECYASRENSSGGTGWWNEETLYEKLTNPLDILYAKRLTLNDLIRKNEWEIENNIKELSKVEYAINLVGGVAE